MLPPEQTVRQRIMGLLLDTRLTSRQLAQLVGISERQVEDHLVHIVKTVARDRTRRFMVEPSTCQGCGYRFRDRSRLTRPSRCPRCRSEAITAPRYGIDPVASHAKTRLDGTRASRSGSGTPWNDHETRGPERWSPDKHHDR